MSVHGYTKNYKLIKPRFDTDTWHDYEYDNLDTIDAVLSAIYASGDWQGFWKNNTSYKAGSVVIDKDTDTMYKVVSDHTTDGNVTFADYMFNHPEYYQLWSPNNLAQDWAIKDDGLADNQDYSAKAYAVGGVGTETNNAKYYSEQASIQAEASAEQAAASASSATASYNSEQLALSHANQAASSAASSLTGAEQSVASAAISQEKAEYVANSVAGFESFVQEKQNEINASLAEAIKASEDAKKYAAEASGANIGDIFYTSRLDNELNGAVEANGAVYNVESFTGEQSVPALLRKGSLPYVSMAEYESIVSTNSSCRFWGWDNGDTFRVPTVEKMKRVLVAKKETTTEDPTWYNLYSDGWCEQGGFAEKSQINIQQGINFLKKFKDNRYTSLAIVDSFDGDGYNYFATTAQDDVTGAKLTVYTRGHAGTVDARRCHWFACGYAEIPSEAEYQLQNIETHRAMVQLSTGVKEDATQLKEYKFNNPHFFGQSMWTDVDPKNSSWLLSNGAYHSGATYGDYYNWLTDIKSGNKTVDGVSVKGVSDEYTDYDWVVNTADSTFRLPLKTKLASGSAVAGNGMTLGFTDGTNNYGAGVFPAQEIGGYVSAYGAEVGSTVSGTATVAGKAVGITTDPEKSGIETSSNGLKLYFYVGDTLQDASLINAGGVLSDVADLKAHTIVETYRNGTEWYRLYSDGWIEQGGYSYPSTPTVSFLKPFSDNNYTLLTQPCDKAAVSGNATYMVTLNHTASGFSAYASSSITGYEWRACGY